MSCPSANKIVLLSDLLTNALVSENVRSPTESHQACRFPRINARAISNRSTPVMINPSCSHAGPPRSISGSVTTMLFQGNSFITVMMLASAVMANTTARTLRLVIAITCLFLWCARASMTFPSKNPFCKVRGGKHHVLHLSPSLSIVVEYETCMKT